MALYHFSLKHVKRSEGHTAIAAAAYRSGEKLYDRYYGEMQDYTRKGGVILSEIMLPDYAPERLSDRETLWYEVEKHENRKDAQLAYSFDFALQNELTMEETIESARQFISENFVAKGMICDIAIHDPDKGEG
ncbi:MAG: MobA/MobL family protein, partial [Lachnospiraceae bacterium]|nr:MobA/MobL family protein [Lachnospiraceae bacterium]